MKRFYSFLASNWQPAAMTLAGVIACIALLWYGLGTLVSGLSPEEVAYSTSHANLRLVLDNPINLLHGTLTALPQLFNIHSTFLLRTVSALFGSVTIISFYFVVRSWHTARIALLSTILFATSAWFLHIARLGVPDITATALIVVLLFSLLLQQGKFITVSLISMAVIAPLLLYTPGMVWFVLPALVWQHRRLTQALAAQALWVCIIIILIPLVLLVPLARTLWLRPDIWRTVLGLPSQLPKVEEILQNLIRIPSELFFRGPANPAFWLGRIPLLGVFSMAMLVVGVYAYWFRRKLDRSKFLIGSSALIVILISLGGPLPLITFFPIIYLFVAAGMTLMLQQWFTVFPRNPLARLIGASLISLAVLVTCYYNISHYFIAWPNTPETKQTFKEKL